jgi:hypothetical protein
MRSSFNFHINNDVSNQDSRIFIIDLSDEDFHPEDSIRKILPNLSSEQMTTIVNAKRLSVIRERIAEATIDLDGKILSVIRNKLLSVGKIKFIFSIDEDSPKELIAQVSEADMTKLETSELKDQWIDQVSRAAVINIRKWFGIALFEKYSK